MSPWAKYILDWALEALPPLLDELGPDRAHEAIDELRVEYLRHLSNPTVRTDLTIRGANLPDLSGRVAADRAAVDAVLDERRRRGS